MRSLTLAAVCFVASFAHAGNVHIVGGPASTAATVQIAVDAAADGDVILLRASTTGAIVVDGKGLTITADAPSLFVGGPIELRNLPATSSLTLRGFGASAAPPSVSVVTVRDCAGHVRLEDLTLVRGGPGITTFDPVSGALRITNCADVAIQRSTATAFQGTTDSLDGGVGMYVTDAQVTAHESTFTGGRGRRGGFIGPVTIVPPVRGGDGVVVTGTTRLAFVGCTIQGGTGGNAHAGDCSGQGQPPFPGGNGGAGLRVAMPAAASVTWLETSSAGGVGGFGGFGDSDCGQVDAPDGATGASVVGVTPVVIADTRRALVADALTREGQTLDLSVTGLPGETAVLLMSSTCQRFEVSPLAGTTLVGPAFRRIALGTVPGSGVLNVSLPIGDLAPGVPGSRRFLQAFCRDTTGQVRLTGCASVVLLDAAY